MQSEIKDLRERCPMCKTLMPHHTKWCGAFSSAIKAEEVEAEQNLVLKSEDKPKGFFNEI